VALCRAKLKLLVKHLGSRRLDEIEEAEIEQLHPDARGHQITTEAASFSGVRQPGTGDVAAAFAACAEMEGPGPRSPNPPATRGTSTGICPSHRQEKLYFAAAESSPDLLNVATLLIDTGLRMGECRTLEWPEVRLERAEGAQHGHLTVRRKRAKNSKARNVPLTTRVLEVLRHRNPTGIGLVFHCADGRPLSQTWLNQQHSGLRALLKMTSDFVLHSSGTLTAPAWWDRSGRIYHYETDGPQQMGHSTVTVSQRYVHPSPETM
jgi:Phage integrase family